MDFTLYRLNHRELALGVIRDVRECVYDFELSDHHDLSLVCGDPISKEDRILLHRPNLARRHQWREFIVEYTDDSDETGEVLYTAHCVDSIDELTGDYIVDRRPEGDAERLTDVMLENSRWFADVTEAGDASAKLSWYHVSAREALDDMCEEMGLEWDTVYSVGFLNVGYFEVSRCVRLFPAKHVNEGQPKRFVYSRNLKGVKRTSSQAKVLTRVYGYGKGEAVSQSEDGSTNYGRKLTFGDINGGKDYVESEEALKRWGRLKSLPYDDEAELAHVTGKVEFNDCEDKQELLRLTTEWAEAQYEPGLEYEADVVDLMRGGLDLRDAREGDAVEIIDETFEPPINITARIIAGKIDLLSPENPRYTISNNPVKRSGSAPVGSTLVDLAEKIDEIEDGYKYTLDGMTPIPVEDYPSMRK